MSGAILLVVAVVAGFFIWRGQASDTKIKVSSTPDITIKTSEDGTRASYYVTPEGNGNPSSTPVLTDDPDSEAALERQRAAEAAGKEYCSAFEKACFKYPGDWKLTDSSSNGTETVRLVSPNGTRLLWQTHSPTPAACSPSEKNGLVAAIAGQVPDYKQFLVFLDTEFFDHRRMGLATIATYPIDPEYKTLKLGDIGTCIDGFGPRFTSERDPTITNTFATEGTDILNTDDVKTLETIFFSYKYQ